MALINKFLPKQVRISGQSSKSDTCLLAAKKQSSKQQRGALFDVAKLKQQPNSNRKAQNSGDTRTNGSNRWRTARVRLLLFRECEVRGRRLIFDSGGVGVAPGQQFKDEFQEMQLMKDMVFGSATLKYSGDNFRVHDFNPTQWKGYDMMLSKVFLIPAINPASQRTENRNFGTGADQLAPNAKDSGCYVEWAEGGSAAGSGVHLSSQTSLATSGGSASSRTTSFGSFSLAIPRIASSARKAASDSILDSSHPSATNGGGGGAPQNRHRRTRLAMALLFSADGSVPIDPSIPAIQSARQLVFDQFALVELFVQRLQIGVLKAYSSRAHFHHLIQEAISRFDTDMDHLANGGGSGGTATVGGCLLVTADPALRQDMGQRFMNDWESIVNETDTKLTRFFFSSLLSALLTYHVNWLYTYVSDPSAIEFFDCGTRILILSKNGGLAQRLLHVLAYFVRLGRNVPTGDTLEPVGPSTVPAKPLTMKNCLTATTETSELTVHISQSKSMGQLVGSDKTPSGGHVVTLSIRRNASSLDRRTSSVRRSSQQLENTRYLRNYYDVRFQLSPDTIAKKDGKPFANLISSIAKNGFQDFYAEELNADRETTSAASFFVGSVPPADEPLPVVTEPKTGAAASQPIQVQIPSLSPTVKKESQSGNGLSNWMCGTELADEYYAGRTLQSCNPDQTDWLNDLQLDLRAASAYRKTVHCVVANTDTWEVQVLTCVEEEAVPARIKQYWVPVTMSGQVAALVESTQLLWQMMRDAGKCLDHVESRLRLMCQKSEDLGHLLSTSIRSWNVDRVTRLLDIENQDLPLLMAGCSVHNPSVASMGGVTIL